MSDVGSPSDRDDSVLGGFQLVRRVANSYLGPLWIALDQRDDAGESKGALVLLRRVQLPEATSPEARQGVVRAAAEARGVRHENILPVLDVLEEGAELGLVYEHAQAEPLRSLQQWANMRSLSFPVGVSLRIAIDLLAAIGSLHRTHSSASPVPSFGGLSPDSVLVAKTGEVKLCDALVASCASIVEGVGRNPAKLAFTAPEQVHLSAPLTVQCDLFSVGAMLWELLANRRLLIGARNVIERRLREHDLPRLGDVLNGAEAVSPALLAIVEAALAGDPSKRAATAYTMAKQLGDCGHPVASREEVAQLVEKLSGQRMERRTASLPSMSKVRAQPGAPNSAALSSARAFIATAPPAREAPPSAPPAAVELEAAPLAAELPVEGSYDIALEVAPAEPAPPLEDASARPALEPPQPSAERATSPGAEPSVEPNAEPALDVESLDAAAGAMLDHEAPPSSALHAFTLSPPPPESQSEQSSRPAIGGKRRGGKRSRAWAGRKMAFGVAGAAIALGAVALGAVMTPRPADGNAPEPGAALAPEEEGRSDAPTLAASRPPGAELPPPAAPSQTPRPDQDDEASSGAAAEEAPGTAADANGEPAEAPPAKDFFVATLDDAQLAEWFALEQQRELSSCSAPVGKRALGKSTQPKQSRTRLANARRALERGKRETALTELCAATAYDPDNVEAQRRLAELALELGDAALAKQAAERGLAAKAKTKTKTKTKTDPALLGVLGDALALLGDIDGGRKAWLETDKKGSEAQRRKRLAALYEKSGKRALASSKFASARRQLRRALILTQAGYGQSVDFADALLSLEHSRAALAWAERAARALPKNARARVLLGDAYAKNGEAGKARDAWRAALRIQPGNKVAARRLSSTRG